MLDRHRDVALFRYSLICEAADASLTKAERGVLVRALARREHLGPTGAKIKVSRNILDRWIRAWRTGGFEALVPVPRMACSRTPAGMLDLAVLRQDRSAKSTDRNRHLVGHLPPTTALANTSLHQRAL